METIRFSINSLPKKEPISLTLGYFDGFHLGHRLLAYNAFENSVGINAILLFSSSPAEYVETGKTDTCLTSFSQKLVHAGYNRYERAYVVEADKAFFDLSHEQFENLLRDLGATHIFVGEDFRYGKKALGDEETLRQAGFAVHSTDLKTEGGEKISSTRIKSLLSQGNIEEANALLGYPYEIEGTVMEGKKIGRTIGFPTLNLKPSAPYEMPAQGVYAGFAYIRGVPKKAMISYGTNPTFGAKEIPSLEAHVLGFDEEIYGAKVSFAFLKRIRGVVPFKDKEELKQQLQKDKRFVELISE